MNSCDKQQLKITAAKVRLGIIEGVYNAKSGHPGGSLSAADIFTYLYFKELHIDPQNPKDPDRDRFVQTRRTRRIRTETVLSFPKATAHRVFTLHWHSAAISLWMN